MNDEQFKKLSEQLAGLSTAIREQGVHLDSMDSRLGAIDGRLDAVEQRLGRVEVALADVKLDTTQLKIDVRLIYRSLDTVLSQQDVETNERVRISDVLNRHERWITGLAKQANLKLSHD